jgi:hypothetical protein
MSLPLKALPILAIWFVASVMPANAGIVCDGNFQIVNGQPVSTPYCEDEQLAHALRWRGAKTSGEAIRRSAELKRESCLIAPNGESGCANYAE